MMSTKPSVMCWFLAPLPRCGTTAQKESMQSLSSSYDAKSHLSIIVVVMMKSLKANNVMFAFVEFLFATGNRHHHATKRIRWQPPNRIDVTITHSYSHHAVSRFHRERFAVHRTVRCRKSKSLGIQWCEYLSAKDLHKHSDAWWREVPWSPFHQTTTHHQCHDKLTI